MKAIQDFVIMVNWYDKKIRKHKNGCWLWMKSRDPNGYGHLVIKGKLQQAHRVSYETHKGPIPPKMLICHTCDVRRCINPDHLFIGTHKDNSRDAANKFRLGNHARKLTYSQVNKIRQLYNTGKYSHRKLAEKFGISKSTISDITLHNHWKQLKSIKVTFQRLRQKLNKEDVQQIRNEYKTNQYTQRELAEKFGIAQQTVSDIITFKKHHSI